VLGSGTFVPEFEDQLVGAKVGEQRTVNITFPEEYGGPEVAGKAAEFAVTMKAVKAPNNITIDNDFAQRLGFDALATLKERVREQVKGDFARASRTHLKRRLLDALDAEHGFDLPPAMLKMEFEAIWKQVETELAREGSTFADEGKTEEEMKDEYAAIAARRVRLGLVLSKVGDQNGLTVSDEEITRAITARARYFPGQEQQLFNYYKRNANALAEIRAPLFEDKVIDFVIELAQVIERNVDRETLFMDPDDAAAKLAAENNKKSRAEKSKAKPDEKPKSKKK
jgi:trigger factor